MHLNYLLDQTGSSNEDEFLERFQQAIKMTETLKGMQSLVDSKLAQLRTEHSELYGAWGESNYSEHAKSLTGGGVTEDSKPGQDAQGAPSSPSHRTATSSATEKERTSEEANTESDVRNCEHLFYLKSECLWLVVPLL
jgi:hypothetical protein